VTKIPPHAQCVFTGIIYDVYQWEQVLFDGSVATFECLKRPDTVVVIPVQGTKVFYARQEQPNKPLFISLFGGRAEKGEAPLEAAKRELLEETGLISNNWEQIRCYVAPSKIDWKVYFFVARDCLKTADQTLDAGEKIEVCTASIDDFINNIVTDPRFSEFELRAEIMSAFDPAKVDLLKKQILGL
jgi:8-oxo-dGTP pyrophosphatase MutT (NUDIX family)